MATQPSFDPGVIKRAVQRVGLTGTRLDLGPAIPGQGSECPLRLGRHEAAAQKTDRSRRLGAVGLAPGVRSDRLVRPDDGLFAGRGRSSSHSARLIADRLPRWPEDAVDVARQLTVDPAVTELCAGCMADAAIYDRDEGDAALSAAVLIRDVRDT